MEVYQIVLIAVAALLVAFIAVLVIRTIMFKPKKNVEVNEEEITFDKDKVVSNFREIVKCKTVSFVDHSLEDDAEFDMLIGKLPSLFPNVYAKCEKIEIDKRALFFKLNGKRHDAPSVLMAHFDVVPVVAEKWSKPPFDALMEDGIIWGRGTLDTKPTFCNSLFAVDKLIGEDFVPENDLYLAYSGGEEVFGEGAVKIVEYFKEKGIVPAMVVDEGGAVVKDIFPGVKESCGLIGIAEKGMMDVEYKVNSNGGHASAPKPHTPVGTLASAVVKVESNPFPFHITKPVAEMFDTLGRRSSFLFRMIFANLWCFSGLLNTLCKKSGGELNALVRTTVAFTQAEGSNASNVIPPQAKVVSNIRLNPMDTVDSAVERLKKTVGNDEVVISALHGMNPSRISDTDCDGWKKVAGAVASTWKGCLVSPYLMVQCSDSRHYGAITDKVYRFSSMDLTKEERGTIHGNDEHIRVEALYKSAEFYIRLVKQC